MSVMAADEARRIDWDPGSQWDVSFGDLQGKCKYTTMAEIPSKAGVYKDWPLVIHLNIRSLPKNFDRLQLMLSNFEESGVKIGAILLCETFLNDLNANLFGLRNFKFFELHRHDQRGGGVGIYISSLYQPKIRTDLSVYEKGIIESIFCEATINKKKIILGEIYRPPSGRESIYIEKLNIVYEKLNGSNASVIIGADQNIDFLKLKQGANNSPSKLIDLCTENGLLPLITKPTRVTSTTQSLIDNIYVSTDLYDGCMTEILIHDLSDHFVCMTCVPIAVNRKSKVTFSYRQCEVNNLFEVVQELSGANWNLRQENSLDENFNNFVDI